MSVTVKIKRLAEQAEIPKYAKIGDAGLDLTAIDCYHDHEFGFIEYGTGLAVEIPEGYVGLIFPRSSISKTPHILTNSVGVIDSGYRGEIKFRFKSIDDNEQAEYCVGDRIGQLVVMPYPKVNFVEITELSNTERGSGGFGHTNG